MKKIFSGLIGIVLSFCLLFVMAACAKSETACRTDPAKASFDSESLHARAAPAKIPVRDRNIYKNQKDQTTAREPAEPAYYSRSEKARSAAETKITNSDELTRPESDEQMRSISDENKLISSRSGRARSRADPAPSTVANKLFG